MFSCVIVCKTIHFTSRERSSLSPHCDLQGTRWARWAETRVMHLIKMICFQIKSHQTGVHILEQVLLSSRYHLLLGKSSIRKKWRLTSARASGRTRSTCAGNEQRSSFVFFFFQPTEELLSPGSFHGSVRRNGHYWHVVCQVSVDRMGQPPPVWLWKHLWVTCSDVHIPMGVKETHPLCTRPVW